MPLRKPFGEQFHGKPKRSEAKPARQAALSSEMIDALARKPNAVKALLVHGLERRILKDWGFDLQRLRHDYRITLNGALALGFSIADTVEAGYRATDFRAANITALEIVRRCKHELNKTLSDWNLREMGFSPQEIGNVHKHL